MSYQSESDIKERQTLKDWGSLLELLSKRQFKKDNAAHVDGQPADHGGPEAESGKDQDDEADIGQPRGDEQKKMLGIR